MVWMLAVPFIFYFTFKNMIEGDWLLMDNKNPAEWPFLAWVSTIVVGCLISIFVSSIVLGIASFIGSIPERKGIIDTTYDLVALREKDGVTGDFYFLGAGKIQDQQYYFWYRRNKDGSIAGGKTYRSPNVRIYEIKDDSLPRMVTFKTQYVNSNAGILTWLLGIDMRDDAGWYPDFYIPKGSIKEGFEL